MSGLLRFLPALLLTLAACTGETPENLGPDAGALAPCPDSPNCVSSDADREDEQHYIEPLAFEGRAEIAWEAAVRAVQSLPRTRIESRSDLHLHAESKSRIFRFVDDVELHLRPERQHIAVRSASRLGHSDLGVNRRRVERLRQAFRKEIAVH